MGISIDVAGGEPPANERNGANRNRKSRSRNGNRFGKNGGPSLRNGRNGKPSIGEKKRQQRHDDAHNTDIAPDRSEHKKSKPANSNRSAKWRRSKRKRTAA